MTYQFVPCVGSLAVSDDNCSSALRGIRYLALWVPFWALVLNVIGMGLTIPTGYGVEDYLGLAHQGAVDGMNAVWRRYEIGSLSLLYGAAAYLAVDTAVFMPFYGALFLALADKFLLATKRDGLQSQKWLRPIAIGLVLALLLTDLVENLVGMVRLGVAGFVGSLLAMVVVALVLSMTWALRWRGAWWLSELVAFLKGVDSKRTMLVALIGLVIGFANSAWWIGRDGWLEDADLVLSIGAVAHSVKTWILIVYLILLGGLVGAWFFGFCIPSKIDSDTERNAARLRAHEERAELRRAVGDMLLRCRYVWIALAVFAGLALVLNQGRDVLYSVAAMETGPSQSFGWFGGIVVFVVSAVGMWSFGFAAWLWSRSVCLMRSPRLERGAVTPLSYADRFARDLARLLGLLPPALFVLLCGSTMHDALMAHEGWVAFRVLLFIVVAIFGGAIFVFVHARDADQQCFYDCYDFYQWDELARSKEKPRFRMFGLVTPFWLPFYAAGAMFACRLLAIGIELAGLGPWPPMVLATFLFTLTFWLSLFGWLSLNEQRIATPWVLLLVVVVGALGFTDLT